MCAVVAALPDDAAVWQATSPDAGWTRTDVLLAALERRVTLLWATVASALGAAVPEDALASPLDLDTSTPPAPGGGGTEPEVKSLREIAVWMRGA